MITFLKKINIKRKKFTTGFTLVETLVALFVFSVSVVVVMAVLSQGTSSAYYARNKMVATYLAEEGIEYFRNMRDTSMLYAEVKKDGWLKFIDKMEQGGCKSEMGCVFNNNLTEGMSIMEVEVKPCDSSCPLFYDGYVYGYSSGNSSNFTRRMYFDMLSEEEMKIRSEVYWTQFGRDNMVSFSQNLSAWIE